MDVIPQPITIKIEEDETVIDLDNFLSTEERITNWNSRVRERIKKSLGNECETSLENLMNWYVKTLNEDIFNTEINNRFLLLMDKHLQYFYSYFKELNRIITDDYDYLNLMEDILAFYLDCHGNVFIKEKFKQRCKKRMRKRLLMILKVYLLNREDRMFHVLMKMRLSLVNDDAKNYLDNVYRIILSQIPKNKSDTAFCRAYILYQKWKNFQSPENWKTLDDMLNEMYSRLPDTINTNKIWKEILSHRNSLIEIIAGDNDKLLCEAYFKYKKTQENFDAINDLDLDTTINEENDDFLNIINYIDDDNEDGIIKTETDIDDDCVIVVEGSLKINSDEIVYEILDDDDDDKINEIEQPSFLDSIDITETETTTKNPSPADSISRPVPKIHNSNNDSVKSREILSRKFTRKKVTINEEIISIDAEEKEIERENVNLSIPHSTFSNSTEPEIRPNGSYASPTSPDISSTCDGKPDEEPEPEPEPEPLASSTPMIKKKIRFNGCPDYDKNESDKEKIVGEKPRINENVEKKKVDIVYTQKAAMMSNNEVHLRYDELKDGLENFDLFADPISSSTNSPSDLTSPEYDRIDDFRNYLTNFQQENKKKPTKSIIKQPRIPLNKMNLKSLARYKVIPSDACLQGQPQVIIETLSNVEINGWMNISENSRQNRLKDKKNSSTTMNLIQVNYDKTTPGITNNEMVHYNDKWRNNTETINYNQGIVINNNNNNNDYLYKNCDKLCIICNVFSNNLNNLFLSNLNKSNIVPPCNPFLPKKFINQPAIIPDVGDYEKTINDTKLPLKKRKFSVVNDDFFDDDDDDFIGPEIIEEIIKKAREESKEDLSYPATPAISIAEIQEIPQQQQQQQPRIFKTAAEKKEMPPPPLPPPPPSVPLPAPPILPPPSLPPVPVPSIVTEQYNNHTYNNPTINYHMNNVPYSFLSYFPPILLPTMNVVNSQSAGPSSQDSAARVKKEKRSKKRKKN